MTSFSVPTMTRYISGRPFQIALSVVVIGWLVVGYSRYLSNPNWEAITTAWLPILTFLATSGLVDLFIVAGLWAAASDGLGDRFLRLMSVQLNAGVEHLVFSSGAGLSLLSLATTILTVANLLYATAAWVLVSTPAFFWLFRRALSSFCRETRKGPACAGSSPGGTTDVSPGWSGAATAARDGGPTRNPGNPEEIDPSPGGAAENLAGSGISPTFRRPSRADPMSCGLTQGFAALHPGLRSAAPPGAETGVWLTFPSFATETS